MTPKTEAYINTFKKGDMLEVPKSLRREYNMIGNVEFVRIIHNTSTGNSLVWVEDEGGTLYIEPTYFLRYVKHDTKKTLSGITMDDILKRYPIGSHITCLVDSIDSIVINDNTKITLRADDYLTLSNGPDCEDIWVFYNNEWANIDEMKAPEQQYIYQLSFHV